jgi:hypothetical protein
MANLLSSVDQQHALPDTAQRAPARSEVEAMLDALERVPTTAGSRAQPASPGATPALTDLPATVPPP